MDQTKLTVRVLRHLLENAKRFASRHNTPLTSLIEACLRLVPELHPRENAPIVRWLGGMLPTNISIQDYRDHLEKKYGS